MTAFGQTGGRQSPIYRGSYPRAGRRPKSDEHFRRCPVEGCGTVLSRYNLGDTCRVHAPIRFPRVRGHT
jgi:hypothetical protein